MKNISLKKSSHTPHVNFKTNGHLLMEGRSFPENASLLYDPLIRFVENLNSENVIVDINLEYFNTASSKKMMELFRYIDANSKVNKVLVNWHYEEGDYDSLEIAEIYEESLLRTEFRYHEHEETEEPILSGSAIRK